MKHQWDSKIIISVILKAESFLGAKFCFCVITLFLCDMWESSEQILPFWNCSTILVFSCYLFYLVQEVVFSQCLEHDIVLSWGMNLISWNFVDHFLNVIISLNRVRLNLTLLIKLKIIISPNLRISIYELLLCQLLKRISLPFKHWLKSKF